jgi:hypothetical protein
VSTGLLTVAEELHGRGVAEQNSGHPLRALRLLDRARRTVESAVTSAGSGEADRVAAAIWISLALNHAEVYGIERGLVSLAEARLRAERIGDPALLVRVHSQHAFIAIRGGQYDVALAELAIAETMLEHADDNDRYAILLNAGLLRLLRQDLTSARRSLTKAVEFSRSIEMPVGEFKALHNLAYLEFLAGDMPRALRLMDIAGHVDADVSRGIWYLDRARVLAETGLVRDADDALAHAGMIFAADRLAQDLAETELERARCALIAGDVVAARRFAAAARDRFRRRGNGRWRRSAELVLLQGDLAAGRPGARLVPPALRLHEELAGDGLTATARTAALIAAEAYLAANNPDAAATIVERVGRAGRREPITARLHSRYVEARLAVAQDNIARAARSVRSGLAELADYQASFGSIDMQTASAVHGQRLAELGVTVALQDGRASGVFAAAELGRAVSSRLPVVRPPSDPQSAQLLADLRQTVESLQGAVLDPVASAPLIRKRRELERSITAVKWTMAGPGAARRTARLEEVRPAVGAADATMVVFVQAGGAMHAVLVGAGPMRLHEIGPAAAVTEHVRRARADLDVLAQPRLPDALARAVRASFERSAAELDRALLAPLRIDGQRLVVVSTGVLGQLPWGTLPSLRGVPVVVAPSATAWLSAHQRPRRRGRREVVAIAGPDLARAEYEVAGVANAWTDAPTHIGAAADRDTLATAMARGTLVHVAAHGTHQTENPLFSSLRLADGPMFAHELDQTARTPEHVVLSACELGLATVRPGDEALGLASVLLHLGTPSVVASVARVGDDLAAETMIDYHTRLAGGADSAEALAAATEHSSVPFVSFGASWRKAGRPSSR